MRLRILQLMKSVLSAHPACRCGCPGCKSGNHCGMSANQCDVRPY
ncbi:hypothetical protein [Streptomyces sp. NPDC003688]